MRKIVIRIMMIFSVAILASCTDGTFGEDDPIREPDLNDELIELTLEELSMYDGLDGNEAYIAVDGVIYDVTGVSAWTGGSHNGNMAGTDVTDVIGNAPHGESVLDNLEIVGSIKD